MNCNHKYKIFDTDFTNEYIKVNLICSECGNIRTVIIENSCIREIINQVNQNKDFYIQKDDILEET